MRGSVTVSLCAASPRITGTRNFLTFVNTTAIAYERGVVRSRKILVVSNNSRIYKRQKITSTHSCLQSANKNGLNSRTYIENTSDLVLYKREPISYFNS